MTSEKSSKGAQAQSKPKGDAKSAKGKVLLNTEVPCPWLCALVPTNVPRPEPAQAVLHPRKDVFVLKVAKVGANGDRRCKMELELVTPKGIEKKAPFRIDTRETQCDPECSCCCCGKPAKKKKK